MPFAELVQDTVDDTAMRAKIDEVLRLKKNGLEHDISAVDPGLMAYARTLADHYNENIETFRPELDKHPTETLDDLPYDTVMK